MTCQCGDVFDDLVDLLNHCRLMHPDADVDPVEPGTVDATSATSGEPIHVVSTHWATAGQPVDEALMQWADEVLREVAAGLDLPPGLMLAWDTTPLLRRDPDRPPPVQ